MYTYDEVFEKSKEYFGGDEIMEYMDYLDPEDPFNRDVKWKSSKKRKEFFNKF